MPGETSPWWRETVVEASLSLNALLSFRAKGGRAARHGSAKTVSDFPGLDRALPGNTGDRSVGRSGGRWIWADMMPAQGEGGGGRGKAGKRGMARRMGREADAHYFPWCLKPIPHQLLHRRLLAHAKGVVGGRPGQWVGPACTPCSAGEESVAETVRARYSVPGLDARPAKQREEAGN